MIADVRAGVCQCGCGARTRSAPYDRPECGWIKGTPVRFVRGHNRAQWKGGRSSNHGYVLVKAEGHPRANNHGYVREHLLIAERALGRPIPESVDVHHVNGSRDDNRSGNLVICQNHAYHFLLHVRTRALAACGNANWRKCNGCGQWDDPSSMVVRGNRAMHRKCAAVRERFRLQGQPYTTEAVRRAIQGGVVVRKRRVRGHDGKLRDRDEDGVETTMHRGGGSQPRLF